VFQRSHIKQKKMRMVKKIIKILFALGIVLSVISYATILSAQDINTIKGQVIVTPAKDGIQITRAGATNSINQETELIVGDTIQTPAGRNATIKTWNNVIVRIDENTSLKFISSAGDGARDGLLLELIKGRVWINGTYTNSNLNLIAGGAFLVSREGAFDTTYDGTKTNVRVFVNQVTVGLVKPGIKFTQAVRFGNSSFINSFLMAQGSQSTIYLNKITENANILKQLLYSKLIKEFLVTLYDKEAAKKDAWVIKNKEEDKTFATSEASEKLKTINARGLKIDSIDSLTYQLQKVSDVFSDKLTFSGDKVVERQVARIFDQIYDAEYLMIYGRNTEAKARLTTFTQAIKDAISSDESDEFQKLLPDEIRKSYSELDFVMPNDPLFEIKSKLESTLTQMLDSTDEDLTEKFGLIRSYMNYTYQFAESNTALLARLNLESYNTRFVEFVNKEKANLKRVKNLIAEENQVMTSLLLQYSVFYQDSYFGIKNTLETNWLLLLPEGKDKNEEKQTIISTKIDFLKKLQQFLLNEEIKLPDAIKIASRLITEINDLVPNEEIGISQIFALRLKDYGQFLRFLKLAESGTLVGKTMREKYNTYLSKQTEQVQIDQIIKEFAPSIEITPEITTTQIIDQVKTDFTDAKITGLILGPLTSVDEKYIEVKSATISGIAFSGQYEWGRKLISNVQSRGVTISEQPIRLDGLTVLLKPSTPKIKKPETTSTQQATQQTVTTPNSAEEISKSLLMQKLKENNINLTKNMISVIDLNKGLFEVKGATIASRQEIKLSFTFNNKLNMASNIILNLTNGNIPLTTDIDLKNLSAEVIKNRDAVVK
jgi:hypothetical protein